jgi:hypothetical protein
LREATGRHPRMVVAKARVPARPATMILRRVLEE